MNFPNFAEMELNALAFYSNNYPSQCDTSKCINTDNFNQSFLAWQQHANAITKLDIDLDVEHTNRRDK